MKAEEDAGPLVTGDDREKESVAGAGAGDSGEADTLDSTVADGRAGADSGTVGEAVAAEGALAVVGADCDEPAVLLACSPVVDAMDMSMAAADTVASLMGMTLAAALPAGASLTGLAATAARVGELGETVEPPCAAMG